jgi:hypothetical protein
MSTKKIINKEPTMLGPSCGPGWSSKAWAKHLRKHGSKRIIIKNPERYSNAHARRRLLLGTDLVV